MKKESQMKALKQNTENVLSQTLFGLLEGLTGAATSSKSEWIISISHIFHKMRDGALLGLVLRCCYAPAG